MGYLEDLVAEAKKEEEKIRERAEGRGEEKGEERRTEDIKGEKEVVEKYGDVVIYRVKKDPLLWYTVPVPRPTSAERKIINLLKEATSRLISLTTSQIRDPVAKRNVYYQKVLEIIDSVPELEIPRTKREFYAEAVVREMVGYGLLDPLVKDDELEEIMVIGPKKPVYVFHRRYNMMKTNVVFYDDEEIQALIDKIAREVGRHIDAQNPLLDARLPDGSRVTATIPPASVGGSTLTIRKFRTDPYTVIDLVNLNTFTPEIAAFLWIASDGLGVKPANILIAGGTGSGKTTTLNVLASFIPANERIITIEDTAELNLPLEHWIRLEARPPGIEGTGEITMDVLVKEALRMRPDRIIVGEVRHVEAFTLFTAMNTGHDGCFGTIHSNSADETMVRIMSPPMNVPEVMATALDFIVVQHRINDRRKGMIRRITEIAEVVSVDNKPEIRTIFVWDPKTDGMIPVSTHIEYFKVLSDFTGLSEKEIKAELERRKRFLLKLKEKGIREMRDVKKEIQKYYEEGAKKWQKK